MDSIAIFPSLLFHYELINKIGEGGNSTIWSLQSKDGLLYAAKIPLDNELNELIFEEANIMSQIAKRPNLSPFLTFYGLYTYNDLIVSVNELFIGIPLSDLIMDSFLGDITLTEFEILFVAKSIFEQLSILHQQGLNHGDISNSNILHNSNRVVLIDITNLKYDQARTSVEIEAEVTRTTPNFWIEAVALGITPSSLYQKKDVFETGEILRELMGYEKLPPWNEFILNSNRYHISSQYPKLDKLINSTLNINIIERPSVNDVLNDMLNDI